MHFQHHLSTWAHWNPGELSNLLKPLRYLSCTSPHPCQFHCSGMWPEQSSLVRRCPGDRREQLKVRGSESGGGCSALLSTLAYGLISWVKTRAVPCSSPTFPLTAHRCPPQRVEQTEGTEPAPGTGVCRHPPPEGPAQPRSAGWKPLPGTPSAPVGPSAGLLHGSSFRRPLPGAHYPHLTPGQGHRLPTGPCPLSPLRPLHPAAPSGLFPHRAAALAAFHFLEHTSRLWLRLGIVVLSGMFTASHPSVLLQISPHRMLLAAQSVVGPSCPSLTTGISSSHLCSGLFVPCLLVGCPTCPLGCEFH